MNIGFEAKRAYHNKTGLGNYARNVIIGLHTFFPADELFAFNPKKNTKEVIFPNEIHEINPSGLGKVFPSIWRSRWQINDISRLKLNIYHGLSHELPYGLNKHSIPSVVTMHDILFEHLPSQYRASDILIYRKKFKHAVEIATHIISISKATKNDLIKYYHVDEAKISVGSSVINQRFFQPVTETNKLEVISRYKLPKNYFISVGSIIERKNLLSICKALKQIQHKDIHLVVIGHGKEYKQKVLTYIHEQKLHERVLFLEDNYPSLQINEDLPALYQLANGLIYPSHMEGFGLPVVEAMAVSCPVITSNQSSLLEAGGNAALFVNPNEIEELIFAMNKLVEDESTIAACRHKGLIHAQGYTLETSANFTHSIYNKII